MLIRFADDDSTTRVLAAVQNSGEAWMSGTEWDGRAAIRLSVSSWRTSDRDVERTLASFREATVGESHTRVVMHIRCAQEVDKRQAWRYSHFIANPKAARMKPMPMTMFHWPRSE